MSSTFNDMSKTIAQSFVQSILFIDDKAYSQEQGDHPFDVKLVIKESADRGLIATAYAPEHQDDLKNIVEVGRKADVIVLDWRMDINDDSGQEQDDEEEEGVADHRGAFAISVIKNLIINTERGDPVDQLKLIFIYTGEAGLQEIHSRLDTELDKFDPIDDFTLSCGGIRISIWAKAILASSFTHMPENKKRLRSYTELLDEVSTEYATVSSGLLSNTCLEALTSLRKNTYTLLAKFSPDLDPAFVAHRAMLPTPDDAGDLLKEIICGELNSILTIADVSQRVSSNTIHDWVSSQEFRETEIKANDKHKITIDNTKRELWQDKGYVALLKNELDTSGNAILTEDDIEKFERYRLKKYACKSFTPSDFTPKNFNEEFSILTHHKRNYLSNAKSPSLSLGVMIKDNERYLLCIQQKCDSVRIPDGVQRKFLFLPMENNDQNFDVLFKNGSQDYVRLSTCYKECYALEIIEFAPFERTGIVQAKKEEDGYHYFIGGPDNQTQYRWILDLKEAHAQRIANNFAAQLSRVGLDESEWLRRN
jgi:hypothetical protein